MHVENFLFDGKVMNYLSGQIVDYKGIGRAACTWPPEAVVWMRLEPLQVRLLLFVSDC